MVVSMWLRISKAPTLLCHAKKAKSTFATQTPIPQSHNKTKTHNADTKLLAIDTLAPHIRLDLARSIRSSARRGDWS